MSIRRPSAFNVRDFRLVTLARLLFGLSVQLQAVVIGWQIYEIKHDPLYLGLTGLVEAAPALSLSLFAGEIVDRSNPLKIYRAVIWLSLLAGLILLLSTNPFLQTFSGNRLIWLYAAAFITGTARGFAGPALYSLIPQLVQREALKITSAWTSTAFQLASVSGPALGGLLYSWHGPGLPYFVEVIGLGAAIVLLGNLTHQGLVPKKRPEQSNIFSKIQQGVRYVFHNQMLLSALSLDMFAVLFGGVTAILPIFAGEILRTGPIGLGILRAAPAAGALLMSIALIRFPIGGRAGRTLLLVIAGFGICMIGFGLSRTFWLSVALLATSGALDSVSMVIRGTIVQLSSPDDMRGRIASVNAVFIGSSNEIGAFESGVAARLLGTVPSVIFGGIMTLVTVGITAALSPRLRKMRMDDLV